MTAQEAIDVLTDKHTSIGTTKCDGENWKKLKPAIDTAVEALKKTDTGRAYKKIMGISTLSVILTIEGGDIGMESTEKQCTKNSFNTPPGKVCELYPNLLGITVGEVISEDVKNMLKEFAGFWDATHGNKTGGEILEKFLRMDAAILEEICYVDR